MSHSQTSVLILLYLNCIIIFASHLTTPALDDIAISCGSSGNSTARDGRIWVGDIGSKSSKWLQLSGKSTKSRAIDNAALMDYAIHKTARISHQEFTYTFRLKAGQKFIRLHFHPSTYKGFKKSAALFTVKAGPYTLLSNFGASLTADALRTKYFSKEFSLNIEENQVLSITFIPSLKIKGSHNSYAFVNGIEIVSMPSGLYFTPDGDMGPVVVGQKHRFYIDNSTALEMVQRLNVGGNTIESVEEPSMLRAWKEDIKYLSEPGTVSLKSIIPISYSYKLLHVAPRRLYQTARSMDSDNNSNRYSLTWKIPVDLGFRYLVRLHFCELEFGITQFGEREFAILMNNHVAEENANVIRWGGGRHGVALYRDYVVLMDGDKKARQRYLSITFQPKFVSNGKQTGGILNGLEIFKLSNPDNNLAGSSPMPLSHSSKSWGQKDRKVSYFDWKNAVATALTVIITLLNITVYHIRLISEANTGARNLRSSSAECFCRQFSIDEVRASTNNFDPQFLIGSGGYGKVYKGSIDGGATIVAFKRLKSESTQGEKEFWTEIRMLSKLRNEHLVPLIGYCNEGQEMVLVYEYMPQGTLADHLYKSERKGKCNPPLSWEQRLKISVGAARGLYFLHTSRHRVIHRDVKSSNILLDQYWVAKISDFGLSKMGPTNESFTHISTNVKGTFGYLDPEYFLTRKLTRKSDVYAFGVVLFEVLLSRPAVDIRLKEEQHSLAAWVRYCIRRGKFDQVIDRNLIEQISPACLKVFVGIAGRCIHNHPHERPAMSDVVMSLELALALQQSPVSTELEKEELEHDARSYSDQSDGIISFEELSSNPPNGEIGQNVMEVPGAGPRTKEGYVLRNSKKDGNSNSGNSTRWWWDPFGLLPRSPSKSKASMSQLQEGLRHFSIQEIRKATNNFHSSLVIGFGSSDSIYKGNIGGAKRFVAIRRSSTTESRRWMVHELHAKKESGVSVKHAQVVSLVGYCSSEADMFLIYDYMPNGSLHDQISDPNKDPLPWNRRLQICIGAARGLSYLQSTVKQTNLHRNFNSTHIFLDENWDAKVSDFGLSKRRGGNSIPTMIRANWGILDSDWIRDEQLTEKSYVFSFGLVLFEVLCSTTGSTRWLDEDQVSLAQWIKSCMRNNLTGHIDPNLLDTISPECFRMFVEMASKCLHDQGTERPSMSEIVASLEAALKVQESTDGTLSVLTASELTQYAASEFNFPFGSTGDRSS